MPISDKSTALHEKIAARIREEGPISVATYMALALGDAEQGYYRVHDPIGTQGDFITAPEISQMFGELLGVWCLAAYEAMGAPASFNLVELGPGRGTLMADLLRAARIRPAFLQAARLTLLEISESLRASQAAKLAAYAPRWCTEIDALPEGPSLIIANEFFDALPVRQFIRRGNGWHERLVGLDAQGALTFLESAEVTPDAVLPLNAARVPLGEVLTVNPLAEEMVERLAQKILCAGGALLVIDYGSAKSGFGDTLQAVARQRFAPVLEQPGAVDLSAPLDFSLLANSARRKGARVFGPVPQGEFLLALGLLPRAARLAAGKDAATGAALHAAVLRLAGEEGMGRLFKVMSVTDGFIPPGFVGNG